MAICSLIEDFLVLTVNSLRVFFSFFFLLFFLMKGWPTRFIHRASDHSPDTPGPFSGQAISTTTAAAAAAAGWTLCFVSISTTFSHILAPSSSDWGATSVCLCQVKPSHFLIFSFFSLSPKKPMFKPHFSICDFSGVPYVAVPRTFLPPHLQATSSPTFPQYPPAIP